MMMKIRKKIYWIAALVLTACTADDTDMMLSPAQQELIGQGVNFSASIAAPFITRSTNQHNGDFNEGDQMRIFRQYADENDKTGTVFKEKEEIYRTYYYKSENAPGTSVSLNSDWVPMKNKLKSDFDDKGNKVVAKQTDADSLTWENGKTVRFRAWSRSNLAGRLSDGKKASYYPDYTVSDWVTVSGPTQNIPLTMRHIACRIGLVAKNGNELASARICLDVADYNGDQEAAAKVLAAYKKMCMPAGVDDETFLLTAMDTTLYNDTTDFTNFEKYTEQNGIVKMGTKDSTYIADKVQHPEFNPNDGRLYFMTIPVDMSSENAGAALSLPLCTRFKVKLVGETIEHTFELKDVMQTDLVLRAGYSYTFSVGYQYDKFSITPSDNFAWDDSPTTIDGQSAVESNAKDTLALDWFFNTYVDAVGASLKNYSVDFNPVFTINTAQEFMTFIKLVNGVAAQKTDKLTRGELAGEDSIHVRTYKWIAGTDTLTRDEAEALGYLFYPKFFPSVSSNVAYAEETQIIGGLDFSSLQIKLGNDIDLTDIELPSIGVDVDHLFKGYFNGCGHTLRNLNMKSGCLFGNVQDAVITNLKIESTHPVCLVGSASSSSSTRWSAYIAGVSMLCPSSENSIAASLKGTSWVAGCIHVGKAGGALVGNATNLNMTGCIQAADGIAPKQGALLGTGTINITTFKYNYYDVEKSPDIYAVTGIKDNYKYDQYIRGTKSHVLKAVNDYMFGANVNIDELKNEGMKSEIYGFAPWTAMNKGIEAYNATNVGKDYPCIMRFSTTSSYANRYPVLIKQ